MGRRWLVSVPVWGQRFVDVFCAAGLPMLRAAARALGESVTLIAHTDAPDWLSRHRTPELAIETRPVPAGQQWFHCMSRAHRDVMRIAKPGEVVVLLTADMVISANTLTACRDALFGRHKKLVCCNATRVKDEGVLPHGAGSRDLSEWGWSHRHAMAAACTWPDGRAADLSRVYFQAGPNVAARLWLAHPLALLADGRALPFMPTIDSDLVANFEPAEVHLVTSPDELAVIELSPPSKTSGSRDADEPPERTDLPPLSKRYAGQHLEHSIYRWMLAQRIVIVGTGEGCGDDEAVKGILGR
jgi:hypothetical protein